MLLRGNIPTINVIPELVYRENVPFEIMIGFVFILQEHAAGLIALSFQLPSVVLKINILSNLFIVYKGYAVIDNGVSKLAPLNCQPTLKCFVLANYI